MNHAVGMFGNSYALITQHSKGHSFGASRLRSFLKMNDTPALLSHLAGFREVPNPSELRDISWPMKREVRIGLRFRTRLEELPPHLVGGDL